MVEKLKPSGIEAGQAEAIVRVIAEAQNRLVTKDDLEIALAPIKSDTAVIKWMIGVLLAGVISLVMKSFF